MKVVLVQHGEDWYRVKPRPRRAFGPDYAISHWAMAHFNLVMEVVDGEAFIIKNRYTGVTGKNAVSDLFRMQLWTSGKTFDDLPEFIDNHEPGGGPWELAKDHEDNLISVLLNNEYEPRN